MEIINNKNKTPFVRVSFSERDNFIKYLAKDPIYKSKIAFIEGNVDHGIPNEIWTNGAKYTDTIIDLTDTWEIFSGE